MENGWEARNPFQAVCIAVDLTEPVPATLRMKISLQMFVTVLSATSALGVDWAGWRGPTHDGIAAAGQKVPVRWDEQRNILWKVPVPGKGHASPTVVEDRIFLPTADVKRKVESVLCLSRKTGKLIWRKDLHKGGFTKRGHRLHKSHASSSVAWDGKRAIVNFMSDDAVYTTALDRGGKELWQTKITDYITHQGYGSSPFIYKSLVLVSADNKGGGCIVGLDRETGGVIWRHERPKFPNYPSPVVYNLFGKDQMLMSGCDLVTSLNPLTGKVLWEIEGSTTECVVTMVTDGERAFTGGGYPRNHTVAVRADGSGKIAWQNSMRIYVPSMIVKNGHLYATSDSGFAICWESATGKELWKERLGGDFFASPVMLDGRIYATNVRGKTFVYEASPKEFKLIAENQLGYESYASPVICGDRIYLRVAKRGDGARKEFLYCIGFDK